MQLRICLEERKAWFWEGCVLLFRASLVFLADGAAACLGAAFSSRLYKRYGRRIILTAVFIIACAFLCYGSGNLWLSVVLFIAAGFSDSLLYPVQSDKLNRLIPSEQRATLISADSLFFSVAMIILFPLAGAIADIWGLAVVFSIIGIGLIAFNVVVLLINR